MQADPEGFIRSLDADTGPDADNPRACGVALLLCMLRKGSSHVAEAMLSYAAHLQVSIGYLFYAACLHILTQPKTLCCPSEGTHLFCAACLQVSGQQTVP